eukprot:11227549-Lingulodinium_polyedra.AAC.1
MARANARLANRRANARWIRPRHCATFAKRCKMARPNRRRANAATCTSHARAHHARAPENWRAHGARA